MTERSSGKSGREALFPGTGMALMLPRVSPNVLAGLMEAWSRLSMQDGTTLCRLERPQSPDQPRITGQSISELVETFAETLNVPPPSSLVRGNLQKC
jgi:hypothetical protein